MLPDVADTWEKLLSSSNGVFRYLWNARGSRQSSSLCAAQYCDGTWMLQHAVGDHDPTGVLRNLVDMAVWATTYPQCRFVRFLYRPTNRWPKLIFGGLMDKLDERSYETHLYSYHTGEFQEQIKPDSVSGTRVEYLRQDEYEAFERRLNDVHSPLMIDSKGLRSHEIDLENTSARYASLGLTRKRDVIVARSGGRIIGYSILDFSSPGINFSFLFNAFLATMFEEDLAAARILAAASINHYLRHGRSYVFALAAPGMEDACESMGMTCRKQYAELTVSCDNTLGPAVSHFREYYGWLKRR